MLEKLTRNKLEFDIGMNEMILKVMFVWIQNNIKSFKFITTIINGLSTVSNFFFN